MTDRDGLNDEILHRFEMLPYKKVLFSSRELNKRNTILVKEFHGEKQVGDLIQFSSLSGKRLYEKINIIDFINNGEVVENGNKKRRC